MIIERQCSKCKLFKSIESFHKDITQSCGYCYQCKECKKKKQKEYEERIKSSLKPTYIEEKKCFTCGKIKSVSEFYKNKLKKTGYASNCKSCEYLKEKEYRLNNLEKFAEKSRLYRERNPDKIRQHQINTKIKNYDKICERERSEKRLLQKRENSLKYRKDNPEYFRNYVKNKKLTDPQYKLRTNLSNRIIKALKGITKGNSTLILLGCSISEFKIHLESKFLPNMSFSNYGKTWHIDHIKPCASFDLTDPEEQKQCFNYVNLQPLFIVNTIVDGIEYIGNLNKGAKIIEQFSTKVA